MILVNDLQLGKHEISTEANFKVEKYWAEISAQIWVKWCPNISPPKIISADLFIRPNISPVRYMYLHNMQLKDLTFKSYSN